MCEQIKSRQDLIDYLLGTPLEERQKRVYHTYKYTGPTAYQQGEHDALEDVCRLLFKTDNLFKIELRWSLFARRGEALGVMSSSELKKVIQHKIEGMKNERIRQGL